MVVALVACVMGTISKTLEVQENIHVIVSIVPLPMAIKKSGWILAIEQIFDKQDMI